MFTIFVIYQIPCVWLPHRKRCCACYWEDVRRSWPTVHGWEATSTYCWLVTLPLPSHRCLGKDMFILSRLYGDYHHYLYCKFKPSGQVNNVWGDLGMLWNKRFSHLSWTGNLSVGRWSASVSSMFYCSTGMLTSYMLQCLQFVKNYSRELFGKI